MNKLNIIITPHKGEEKRIEEFYYKFIDLMKKYGIKKVVMKGDLPRKGYNLSGEKINE